MPAVFLSTVHFDATTVNPSSAMLQGTPVSRAFGKPVCAILDVNRDGLRDLTCVFVKTGLAVGHETAVLEGTTFLGKAIRGQDVVNIIQAPKEPRDR